MEKKRSKNTNIMHIMRVMVPKCIKASPKLWLAMVCTDAVYSIVTVILVRLLQGLFDNVAGVIEGSVPIKAVIMSMLLLGFFKLIDQFGNSMSNTMPGIYYQKAYGKLNYELHEKVARLKPICFEDTVKLDHINKADQGCSNAIDFVCRVGYIFTYYGVYIVAMFIYLLTLNKLLALAILVVFIPNMISQYIRMKVYDKAEDKSAPIRRQYDYYENCMTDREYYKETRLLGAFSYFRKLYLESLDALQLIKYKASLRTGLLDLALSIISIFGYAGVLFLLFRCLLRGDISVGAFAAVFASVEQLYNMVESMMRYSVGQIATQYGTINNYLNFLELEEDGGEEYIPSEQVEIDLNHVSFAYPCDPGEVDAVAGRHFRYDHYGNLLDSDLLKDIEESEEKKPLKYVLKDINLHINKGETIAIVGENGSGKSTIIRLITGLYEPLEGCIKYNGRDIAGYKKGDIYGKTSAVFQKYQRYQMTLKENICISDVKYGDEEKENLDKISEQAGISMDEKTYPEGYDTMLSREFEGVDLSGGQWQRVAIGRAFYRDHGLIVLDEPTSAIDPYEETRIYNKFAEIAKGKTSIIVTHRLGSVKLADRIVVMKEGEIVQVGTHNQLIGEEDGEYARLYKAQEQWYKSAYTGGIGT